MNLQKEFQRFSEEKNIFSSKDIILLAVSGGVLGDGCAAKHQGKAGNEQG